MKALSLRSANIVYAYHDLSVLVTVLAIVIIIGVIFGVMYFLIHI